MINGISHITFIVQDINKTSNLLIKIFDAKEIYSSDEKYYSLSKEKYFMINDIWIAIMEGEKLKEKTYNHIAFNVSENDFGKYFKRINDLDLEILNGRQRIKGEGKSIYFYDYDNHLFEIHTGTLEERLKIYTSD
jgi:catechol 2,3-dioxygenase-like lactoylglutathione lyase family enzyme